MMMPDRPLRRNLETSAEIDRLQLISVVPVTIIAAMAVSITVMSGAPIMARADHQAE
jgi:hypothetical protein